MCNKMPTYARKKYRKSYKPRKRPYARTVRRTYRPRRNYNRLSISRAPFPKSVYVPLKYVDTDVLTLSVAGNVYSNSLFANACYDPYPGVGGHQPMGFDQWMTVYDHWAVVKSKITVTFYNRENTAADNSIICGLFLDDDQNIPSSFTQIAEMPSSKYAPCSIAANRNQRLSKWYSARKDLKRSAAYTDSLRGDAASNCSELQYFHYWASPMSLVTGDTQIDVQYQVTYWVLFTEPKTLPQS